MDETLRLQLLRASVRDRAFLKSSRHNLAASTFPTREEQIVAEAAIEFYTKYEDPVGGLIRSIADDKATALKLGAGAKAKLRELLDTILGAKLENVSVRALEDATRDLRHKAFYEAAVEEIISSHESSSLNSRVLEELVEKANRELNPNTIEAADYFNELEGRIERRQYFSDGKKLPLLMIDELDKEIKIIGRGHTAMWLAPYSSGKGMALVHTDIAMAMQSLNVLHITLEDPQDEVENRLDGCITGLAMGKLHMLPNRLRKRFKRIKQRIHGRIKIVDGTAEAFTVTRIERLWEQLALEGFVADAVIVDYDEQVVCEKTFKGESARRYEYDEVYRRFNRFAAKRDIIFWTAAQTTRGAEGKRVVTGKDAAEDISKIRKVFLAIGIGVDSDFGENGKYLYVCRHRLDRSRFGVSICADFSTGTFYDRPATALMNRKARR